MYTFKKLEKVDPKNPYAPEFHGTFELSIPISSGTRTRRVIAYVPRDARESTSLVLVLGPNGKTADDLFQEGFVNIACALIKSIELKHFTVYYGTVYDL